jgi:hypothetical protein
MIYNVFYALGVLAALPDRAAVVFLVPPICPFLFL